MNAHLYDVPRSRESASMDLPLDLIAEDRDGQEVPAQRQLVEVNSVPDVIEKSFLQALQRNPCRRQS